MSNSILPEGLLRFIDNYDEKHPNECSARYRNTYELKTVEDSLPDAAEAITDIINNGVNAAMNRYNGNTKKRD